MAPATPEKAAAAQPIRLSVWFMFCCGVLGLLMLANSLILQDRQHRGDSQPDNHCTRDWAGPSSKRKGQGGRGRCTAHRARLPSEAWCALMSCRASCHWPSVWVTEKIRCPVQSSDAHPLCRTPGERKGGSDVRHVKPKVGARPELNAFVKMGLRVRVRRVGQGGLARRTRACRESYHVVPGASVVS